MRKGLTLLEITVAIIVLGLCIGMVIIGQAFLSSARIKNFVRDFQSYNMAVANFNNKYRQLPGDSNIVAPNGNADRKINDVVDGGVELCGQEECVEPMFFWHHLSEMAMLNQKYDHDYTNGMKPEHNVPNLTIGTYLDGVYIGYNDEDEGSKGPTGNFYDINGSHQIDLSDVLAIEAKIDDSSTATGFLRASDSEDNDCTDESVGQYCSHVYMSLGGKGGVN